MFVTVGSKIHKLNIFLDILALEGALHVLNPRLPVATLSNNNKWRWCLRMVAANLSADSQPKSVGLV